MSEFVKGAYNIHEHNHTEWSDKRLNEEVATITALYKVVKYTGERERQMKLRMKKATWEQEKRYGETHLESESKEMELVK